MKVKLFLVVFLIGVLGICGRAQVRKYQFAQLDVNKGLSHNQVNDFYQDSRGFMWFGTISGLNRFDGYNIKVYRNIQGDTTSLLNNDINRLFEGPNDKLWIYTWTGASVYDPVTETFQRNTNRLLRELSIPDGIISYIEKSNGAYWFIHATQGLFRYTTADKKTNHVPSLATNQISMVKSDSQGNLWVIHTNGIFEKIDGSTLQVLYTNKTLSEKYKDGFLDYSLMVDSDNDLWLYIANNNVGCYYFNSVTQSLLHISSATSPVRINTNIVRRIVQDNRGLIWIATDHGGINLIDKKNNFLIQYILHDDEDEKSLCQNSINSLYRDRDGIMWVGTYKRGISYYHDNIFRFQRYRHNISKPESLPFDDINCFAEDTKGNLWIGTNGGGLIYFDRKNNSFKQYLNNPKDPTSLSNNVIVSLFMDHENNLWIGTYYGGLNRFDGRSFTHYKHDPSDPESIGDDNIWEILEDSKKNLWIGTMKAGVDVFDRNKNAFFHYRNGDLNSINTTYVPALMEDSVGNMWIGTGYGISVLEKQSGRFIHYLNDPGNPSSLSNNSILSMIEDSRGLIWIGTHGGLNLFDKSSRAFRSFNEKDGLPHNSILALVEDNLNEIWLSTPNGLSKLTIHSAKGGFNYTFKNYDESDGLQGKAFNESAALKTSRGELVFGGSNGFNIFRPEEIQANTIKPEVTFTDFQIFNRSIRIGEEVNGEVVLNNSVSSIKEITLKHADNVFSLEFSAISFIHPEKSQYQYKLEGFNKEWLTTDASDRKVTFTNLDPGEYLFHVKAANNDGIWNDKASTLRISILPPFWKSTPAFVLYACLIIGALLLARWLILVNERMTFRIQQERHEAQRMHELDMMKIKFFTNVSHEFRTPLTLILTPLEKILKQTQNGDQKNQFQLIHRNAKRLLNLVNQLLDFRKMEVQKIKLNTAEGDIIQFIQELVNSFSDLSEKKNIQFSFTTAVNTLETLFDQDKVEKILFNLLSNAFKFTPENGSVSVALHVQQDENTRWLEIQVKDTGIGIPEDKQDKIFERFFQSDVPQSMVNQGSGIGLSITKEFVKIHGGTITVESEPGAGSCFTVLLPVYEIAGTARISANETGLPVTAAEPLHDEPETELHDKKPVLLLVEDNEDFRFYLKDNLKSQYHILEARNGKEGLQKAQASLPDLIVSDVMMPEMDGITLCKKIRTDANTSHIPIILLTARTGEDQKLEGFETGANDYITKPFNFEILQSRIKNLVAQRELFQRNFQKHLDVKASDVQITSLDEKLIQNAIKVVEDHIANADFSVEDFSRELGMSRVHLYKKLLSLTGKSPIEFIRTIRLQRAAQLLEKSQLTVAEVAYKVGFNNPKYFARYFKEQFNILPSAYASSKRLSPSG